MALSSVTLWRPGTAAHVELSSGCMHPSFVLLVLPSLLICLAC